MRKTYLILLISCLHLFYIHAADTKVILENVRTVPYPQKGDEVYINPCPLIVPQEMKQGEKLQFNLSQDKTFRDKKSILSEPVSWHMFNPHRKLENGTWYWRFRSVNAAGEKSAWSPVYSFNMTEEVPVFVTPTVKKLLSNIPQNHPRIYCFLGKSLDVARKQVWKHPEFEAMITDSRTALSINYANDTKPYQQISKMSECCDNLNTAYQMLQRDVYADKMVQNVRYLLQSEPDPQIIENDFKAGELVYTLACTYDHCYQRFNQTEREQIENMILKVLKEYYFNRILGKKETHIFDNHFWQFTFRHFLQGALVIYDKYPLAKEYLEYSYELWTARAPASGFNRDGLWHNGANYFSANSVTLSYVPTLFSYLTGVDFMQHPWYKNVGQAMLYSWQPEALTDGFGDGHEKMNNKPLRIRSAFADFIARTTGDAYAAWYSSINTRYQTESETRLFRMASGLHRPHRSELPADVPKAVWFKDCGEMIANSNLKDYKHNISLSFRSSPFGSGSHTHSNQNAFNLHYGGKAIYHAVGHYMNFSDKHNLLSYRHTRAHNTMLIDGIGQPFTTRAYGNIVRMFNGEHISYALGDASNAYCGISEYPMWKENFAKQSLEQSRENGFGETPLKKYLRHIFLLHPNIVVIYDELEAEKEVRWDWLLHSPVKFDIDEKNAILTTRDEEGNFVSTAQLFCEQKSKITQTDEYLAAPNEKNAVRGENFTKPWSLTASFESSKKNRILTVIQVEANGCKKLEISRSGNQLQCGNWTIQAELDSKRPASLYVHDNKSEATFTYTQEGTTFNDEKEPQIFSLLNLDYPGLEQVRDHVEKREYNEAARSLLSYYRNRDGIVNPALNLENLTISKREQQWADEALEHTFYAHDGYQPAFNYGKDINWRFWPIQDNELRWQLHRHKWFVPMGKAYRISGNEKYAQEWVFQYTDWIKKNPLMRIDKEEYELANKNQIKEDAENVRFAWRPLETSHRLQDQISQFSLFITSPAFTPEFLTEFLVNYHQHAVHILENYSAGGNHLLFQAQRMLAAGAFFPEFKEAAAWRKSGISILNREIGTQVYKDGGQFELDPHYHLACIEIFYKALVMADANGFLKEFPSSFIDTVEKMIVFYYNISFPDYLNPCFSDAKKDNVAHILMHYKNWQKLFPDNEQIRYYATQGKEGKLPAYLSKGFTDSGFFTFRNGWKENATVMVVKAGPQGEWHCQPDNGTFELWFNGKNLFPDSGSYVYAGDEEVMKLRNWFRQTAVHNTLTLDNKNLETTSSVTKLWQPEGNTQILVTENPSYKNLKHRRSVFFVDQTYFVIVDEAIGTATGNINLHYQLCDGDVRIDPEKKMLISHFKGDSQVKLQCFASDGTSLREEEGWYSLSYRQRIQRTAISFDTQKKNDETVRFITVIYPSKDTVAFPGISARFISEGSEQNEMKIEVMINKEKRILDYKLQ